MPSIEDLENPKSGLASEIYSSDNVLLGKYFRENRSPVEYSQISPHVIKALIATEDTRFYEHSGIDFKASFAILYYVLKGDQRGSSTITQQLAKNLYKTRGDDSKGLLGYIPGLNLLISKIKEWITAIKLESNYTKEEILNMYLNTVDFGSNAFGIKVASETFFSTQPNSLTVEQAATLVGLLKATTVYSPVLNPENSLERRNTVMRLMVENGDLSQHKYDSLKKFPLRLNYNVEDHTKGIATYFRTVMKIHLMEWCKANGKDLYTDGLKIYTTIDSRMQKYAEEAVAEHMKGLQQKFNEHWVGKNPWIYENKKHGHLTVQ
ncbi:MAG: penicillin-binding protein [Cytophagaceae bacterium]|nr:penicillin-binding protein [Cytophagaceae bacterium]